MPFANDASYFPLGTTSNPLTTGVYSGYGLGNNTTGVAVTPFTAIGSSAVFAAVRVLSEDMAKLGLEVQVRDRNGFWAESEDHPLAKLIRNPNRWHNSFDWVAFMSANLAMRGNAYACVLRDNTGVPISLIPLNPDLISVWVSVETGEIYYHVQHQLLGSAGYVFTRDEMVHVRGSVSFDGYTGVSPIAACACAVGSAIAMEQHGGSLFRNGATLGGFLKVAGRLSPEAAAKIADSLRNAHSGVHQAGKIMVLENGSDFTPAVMTAAESQFIEARNASIGEIARIFRVPPSKLQSHEDSHYANLESIGLSYVDETLGPIAKRFELELNRVMLFDREQGRVRFRFNFEDLLRGDTATRYNSYATGITNMFMTPNEARAKEGMHPLPGGDDLVQPLNMGGAQPAGVNDPMPAER